MKIAVLSGKGGTGKTTVSTSLAFISGITILDMDIEAPNTQLFLKEKEFEENKVNQKWICLNVISVESVESFVDLML